MHHTTKQIQVYLISAYHMNPCGYLKIGITQNYKNRLTSIQSSSPFLIITKCVVEAKNPYKLEQEILNKFKRHRIRGEWFSLHDRYEDEMVKKTYLLEKEIAKFMVKNSVKRIR